MKSIPVTLCLLSAAAAMAQSSDQKEESTSTGSDVATMTVTASAEKPNYNPPAIDSAGLKIDIPLMETPQAISVVTEEIIKDQDAQKLEDVLRNVAGISPGGYYEGWDYYRIRGFDSAFNTFWDGLRGDYGMNAEVFGLEKVEVIKGPASTLYGQAPLGGVVNLVSKRPYHGFGGEVGFTAGSDDFYKGTFDINTPLLTPGSSEIGGVGIYGRFVGMYKDAGSFIDHVSTERLYLAPSVTFEFGKDTTLTLLANYTDDSGVFAMPLPARGTVMANPNGRVPIDLFLGLPGVSNEVDQSRLRLGYDLKHRFNDLVSLRQNFSYSRLEQDWDDVLYNSSLAADNRTMSLYPYALDEKLDRVGVDTALDFTFDTGSVKHTLTVGTDYYWDKSRQHNQQIDYSDPNSYVTIDIFNPVYNFNIPAYATNNFSVTGSEAFGMYLQDHAKLTDKLTLTLGGRYDRAEDRASGDNKEAFTPKAGITYEIVPQVAAYMNYSTSFKPQWYSVDANGNPVDPEEGENWETGVKYSLFDGKLNGMASVFHLTRDNVATDNPSTPDPFDAAVSGQQRSQGFEWENSAELLPGLKFSTAYTYLDAEVTKDNTLAKGTRLLGVPEHAVNAWLKYTIQEGAFEGLGAGFGGRYYSNQAGDNADSFQLPAYGILDAAIYYEKKDFSAQINFNNLTDKRHFVGSYNDLYVLPGEPFNVNATVTWKF